MQFAILVTCIFESLLSWLVELWSRRQPDSDGTEPPKGHGEKKKKKKNASDFARLGLQDQNHQSHIGYLYDGTYMTRKSLRAEYTSQMSLTYLEAVSSAKN